MFVDEYGLTYTITEDRYDSGERATNLLLDTIVLAEFKDFVLRLNEHPYNRMDTSEFHFRIYIHKNKELVSGTLYTKRFSDRGGTVRAYIRDPLVKAIAPKSEFELQSYEVKDLLRVLLYSVRLTVSLRKDIYTIPVELDEKLNPGS